MPRKRERPSKKNLLRIRRATLRDVDILVEQRHNMWKEIRRVTPKQHRETDAVYRKWVTTMIRKRKLVAFLGVTKEGKAVAGGCVWVREVQPSPWSNRPTTPYLLSMYTDPSFRGEGLATRIVKEAIKWCKVEGFHSMSLHASDMGRGLYEKLGFEQTREMRLRFKPR